MKKKTHKEIPIGGLITEAGNSAKFNTGSWKAFLPVRDEKKCTQCLLCWLYCPDMAIKVKNGKIQKFDEFHCKGCGICAKECPVKCIKMVKK